MKAFPLQFGIIGCGTIVETAHLPATLLVPEVEVVALVDRDEKRARSLSAHFGISQWFSSHQDLIGRVDGVLIATPPATHAQIACDLLSQGIHVLCEKPLGPTTQDCRKMIVAAQSTGTLLVPAHSRRFHANKLQLKILTDLGAFGEIKHIHAEDGFVFSWPSQTGYMFQGSSATGVLLENGTHVLDTLLWLLGPVGEIEYKDDALGGVESNAELKLHFNCGATGEVKVSRTADLSNLLEIHGDLGWARCPLYEGDRLEVNLPHSKSAALSADLVIAASSPQDIQSLMAEQLSDFAQSIVYQEIPRTTAEDGLLVVDLIERSYAQRAHRPLPDKTLLPGEVYG